MVIIIFISYFVRDTRRQAGMAVQSLAFFYFLSSLSEADTSSNAVYTRRRMLHSRARMATLRRKQSMQSRRKAAVILTVITQMIADRSVNYEYYNIPTRTFKLHVVRSGLIPVRTT